MISLPIFYCSHPVSPLQQELLANLLAQVDASLPEPLQERSYFSSFDEIAAKFLRDGLIVYAADNGQKLVGVAVVYADPNRYFRAYETYIAVLSSHRRQGIGKVLSLMEVDVCRAAGVRGIMTNCDPRNDAKIAMNKTLGYARVGEAEEVKRLEQMNPKWAGKAFFVKEWA